MNHREFSLFVFLGAAFVAALVTANVLAVKIVSLGGLFVPAGVLAYSITFAVTDTVCEVWGRRRTQTLVNAGFLVLILVWGLTALAVAMPAAPFWPNQEAFGTILGATGGSLRIIFASLIAYGVSQTFDVWIFTRIKELFAARHLWIRNNVSTLLSQTLDTGLFITIAFYGQLPLLPLMAGQLAVKYAIALLDTPVVYSLVYLVRLKGGAAGAPSDTVA